LRIGIDVGVEPGFHGGIATAVGSLIAALGKLTDGSEEYSIIVNPYLSTDWLLPLAANQKFEVRPKHPARGLVRRTLSPLSSRVRRWLSPPRTWPEVPVSNGFHEGLNCDVMHFPTQHSFTLCAIPCIYNPHDLQHLHYPQFFSPTDLAIRETIYPAGCHFARTVIVNSQWVKEDLTRQYALPPTKIQVIPEAAPTQLGPPLSERTIDDIKDQYGLDPGFVLYPGVTWPHKNHLRLLEALAYLRDRRGLRVLLVCTGARHEPSWPQLELRMTELGLRDQVRFLGFVSQEHLRGLYHLARCLVLPSLFEANSLPIFEAWLEGTPVACANITALPEQLADAGLLFDPLDPMAIGDTLAKLLTDDALCEDLRAKGRRRLQDFDWTRTAKAYRAVYRQAAGQRLSEEDRMLLGWDWMRHPRGPAPTPISQKEYS
jgi:glycosyltransferase involved in cell wall biosynthesis